MTRFHAILRHNTRSMCEKRSGIIPMLIQLMTSRPMYQMIQLTFSVT